MTKQQDDRIRRHLGKPTRTEARQWKVILLEIALFLGVVGAAALLIGTAR